MKVTRDIQRDERRESQTPARSEPIRPCPNRPYRSMSLGEAPIHSHLSYARAASEPSDTHQPRGIATAWMEGQR